MGFMNETKLLLDLEHDGLTTALSSKRILKRISLVFRSQIVRMLKDSQT